MDLIHLTFELPELPEDSFKEEFFVGVWHPSAKLQVNLSTSSSTIDYVSINGRNWSIFSSRSPFHKNGTCLAHTRTTYNDFANAETGSEVVAFRGYILEPPTHTWSESELILNYWQQEHSRHNGVFATVIIGDGGKELKFITDAFGIATLYYRNFAGGVLFSTSTRFLTTASDQIDKISASIFMHCGSVYGNRSLTEGVNRVPPGTILKYSEGKMSSQKWFAYSDLPKGTKPITPSSLHDVEEAFQASMERCLRLQTSGYVLPLSSGYDSRRILAALHSRKVPFSALTVRVLQKENHDLDGHWASVMARELGFKHQVVELPSPDEYARLDHMRRLLVDSHVTEHTWFLTMYPHIPQQSCLLFDGLAGDTFGNTGFFDKELHIADEKKALRTILDLVISSKLDRIMDEQAWPTPKILQEYLSEYLLDLLEGRRISDVAFMMLRTRTGPGMCFQRLVPAGHVTVYPYLDLDYASITLQFDPLEKMPPHTLQAQCLEVFWPNYFMFPGNNKIPPDSKPKSRRNNEDIKLACFREIYAEAGYPKGSAVYNLLTMRAFAIATFALIHKGYLKRARWWLEPLMMLLAKQANNRVCWTCVSP